MRKDLLKHTRKLGVFTLRSLGESRGANVTITHKQYLDKLIAQGKLDAWDMSDVKHITTGIHPDIYFYPRAQKAMDLLEIDSHNRIKSSWDIVVALAKGRKIKGEPPYTSYKGVPLSLGVSKLAIMFRNAGLVETTSEHFVASRELRKIKGLIIRLDNLLKAKRNFGRGRR